MTDLTVITEATNEGCPKLVASFFTSFKQILNLGIELLFLSMSEYAKNEIISASIDGMNVYVYLQQFGFCYHKHMRMFWTRTSL